MVSKKKLATEPTSSDVNIPKSDIISDFTIDTVTGEKSNNLTGKTSNEGKSSKLDQAFDRTLCSDAIYSKIVSDIKHGTLQSASFKKLMTGYTLNQSQAKNARQRLLKDNIISLDDVKKTIISPAITSKW